MPDWAREYFERGYAQRWGLPAPSEDIRLETDGLCRLLDLAPSSRVVDIGCGHGRHALALAERGHQVIGVDFAVSLLSRGQRLGTDLGVQMRWIRGDMRRLPLRSQCVDAAVSMDALGFFETATENEEVLTEVARVLKAGGRLGLKVVNGGLILDGFRATDCEERDGAAVAISRTLRSTPPGMVERISVRGSRGTGEYERHQRLYRAEELCGKLERDGFHVAGVFASPHGAAFESATSMTMWIIAGRDGFA